MSDTPEKTYLLPSGIEAKTMYTSMPCENVARPRPSDPNEVEAPRCGHYATAGTILTTLDGAHMISAGDRWCQLQPAHAVAVHGGSDGLMWTGGVAVCVCCESRANHVGSVLGKSGFPTLRLLARGTNEAIYLCDAHYRMDWAGVEKAARERVQGAAADAKRNDLLRNHYALTECWPEVDGGVYTVDDGVIPGADFFRWMQSAVKLAKIRGGDWKFRASVADVIPDDVMQAAQSFWRDQTGIDGTLTTEFRRITQADLTRSYTLFYSVPKTPIRHEPERSEQGSWSTQVAETAKALAKVSPGAAIYVGSQKVADVNNFTYRVSAESTAWTDPVHPSAGVRQTPAMPPMGRPLNTVANAAPRDLLFEDQIHLSGDPWRSMKSSPVEDLRRIIRAEVTLDGQKLAAAPSGGFSIGSVAKSFQFSAAAPPPPLPPVAARCSPMTHAALPLGCERSRWDAVVVAVNADVREPPRGPSNKNAAEHIYRDLLGVAAVLPAYVKLRKEGYGVEAAARMAIASSPFKDDPEPVSRYLRVYEAAR